MKATPPPVEITLVRKGERCCQVQVVAIVAVFTAVRRPIFWLVPGMKKNSWVAAVPPLPIFLSTSRPAIITQLWLSGMIRLSVGW